MTAGCVYKAAKLLGIIHSRGYRSVGRFQSIGVFTLVNVVISDSYDRVAPAITQETAHAIELIAVLSDSHLERVERKARNVNVLFGRVGYCPISPIGALCDAADKATDLGNLAASAIAGLDFSADLKARNVECRDIIAHIADGAANTAVAIKRFSCSDARLSLATVPKRNRRSCRHAACNTTNVHIVGERIIACDIRFARCARQRQTTRNGARKRPGIDSRTVIELHGASDCDVGDGCAVDGREQAQAAVAVDFAVAVARVIAVKHSFTTLAVLLADGKVNCAATVQRSRENLRAVCTILRETRQARAFEINSAVHRNGRGLQAVKVVFGNAVNHRVVAVGLPGNRKFGEILNRG